MTIRNWFSTKTAITARLADTERECIRLSAVAAEARRESERWRIEYEVKNETKELGAALVLAEEENARLYAIIAHLRLERHKPGASEQINRNLPHDL